MDDKTFYGYKKRVEKHFDWWLEHLGLKVWTYQIDWFRDEIPDEDSPPGRSGVADIEVYPDRLDINIRVSIYQVQQRIRMRGVEGDVDAEEKIFEEIVIHELSHALVSELRPMPLSMMPDDERLEYLFHEERVVAQLVNAFFWIANHGHERPRRKIQKQLAERKEKSRAG